MDDPLLADDQLLLEEGFLKVYGWKRLPNPRRMGCDALLGRVFRESHRHVTTLYAVMSVKLLSTSRKGQPAKKARLHPRLTFDLGEGDDIDDDAPALRLFLVKLDAPSNTWAVAGYHEVTESSKKDTNKVKYADWSDMQ